jgi:NAD(P)-dependent dehydrogenase (short-subunit alcohol dehydrogenase family)
MTRRFDAKTVLVTGATSGIGRAIAMAFAREGANVVLAGRRAVEGQSVCELIERDGGSARFVQTDVTQPTEVARMVRFCEDQCGGLDIAVNSAGLAGTFFVPTADYPQQVWHQVIDVNLHGLFYSMQAEIAAMLKLGGGSIVNLLSGAGLRAHAISPGYTASKWAGVGITKAAALEYAARQIRINGLCPGVVLTDMAERAYVKDGVFNPAIIAAHPMGRLAGLDEVAAGALWLCSSEAAFITGVMLPIDGGATAG